MAEGHTSKFSFALLWHGRLAKVSTPEESSGTSGRRPDKLRCGPSRYLGMDCLTISPVFCESMMTP